MCGIMGYIGTQSAQEILLNGLEHLSYRGYDSAGVAVQKENRLQIVKTRGRIDLLRQKCQDTPLDGTLGIGHTRWATHGPANDLNAHPHTDARGRIAIVHNGVIENHAQLRQMLTARGFVFRSDTDTECAAHLLRLLYDGDMLRTLLLAARYLTGSYAIAALCADDPSALYCIRSGSPLILGTREGESYLSSDIPALLPYTRELTVPEDGEAAVLRRSGIYLFSAKGQRRRAQTFHVSWDMQSAEKGVYPHFMLKEIHEQPQALHSPPIIRKLPARAPSQAVLLGCGTAYHACLLGAYYMERLAGIPAFPEIASEYRSRIAFPYRDCACIAVSQSGETADTISAARMAKARGAVLVTLTNTLGSTLERMSPAALLTPAGPELSVASTKAYTAQALALLQLALRWGRMRGTLQEALSEQQLLHLPHWAQEMLSSSSAIQAYIEPRADQPLFFFIGRGADAVTAREAALKFKEITYTPAESYPAGELKHGAIALIHEGMPVIAICTQPEWLHKTLVNLSECRARGAECVCFCLPHMEKDAREAADHVFVLPDMPPLLAPIISVIPLQLLAYYAACKKGLDVDKPRNLAKSVTVE
ncbi:MAG: glutamine--fructose-6-phosphate transaminase (isomerizing) [Clostridia bacterium]|nr:glutamine--fructose-6-phosphate transaminase (isomerizing) [Clostridia bacterium]MBR6787022.1 glutamine--fructose-6-phosphate transaminase (isomerizing) [Clostridia bacterium]